jgi:phenylpropionate dioxygenase-like ring-hydroxylating dioxygenase large terminal subunit
MTGTRKTGEPVGTSAAIPKGARFVQGLLDSERRPVPPSLRAASFVDLGNADIPRERYVSRAVEDLEVEKIWKRVWQVVCREEEIANAGDTWVHRVAGASVVVVRCESGEIAAFHNSCLHRGTQLRSENGNVTELRCPFHGFTWRLDGTFAGMPCRWDFPHVDTETFCLPRVRTATWGGFVFVTLDPDQCPLSDYLEILPEHFATWPLDERYTAAHVVRPLPCNWKVALEAFIEAYHTVAVHPQLLTTSGDAQTEYDVYPDVLHVNRMITPVGVASSHKQGVDEQQIVRSMFATSDDPSAVLPEGGTARELLADRKRRELEELTGRDFHTLTDCEALDAIEYFVFPNFVPWAGYTTPLAYLFRPFGQDPAACLMDVWLLEPTHVSRTRPRAAAIRRLEKDEPWASATELGYLGPILDQDTATLERIQRGLDASVKPGITLSHYQESRIRHFHSTLGRYLDSEVPREPSC